MSDGDQVPADCILLTALDNKGQCLVQTDQLDGERNLKPKFTINEI